MARASTARAKAKAKTKKPPTVEELYFRSDSAYLCLILNRRTRFVRVIDFRAGALPAKRLYIQSVAKQEGVEKVITLVEKDEVSSWTKVGFVREGTIPGFYKRSDGHLCGCVIGDSATSVEVTDKSARATEKLINQAKKDAKELPSKIKGVTVQEIEEADALKARDQVWKKGLGVGCFDAFGRDAARAYYSTQLRKGKPNYISVEYQDCFGHSMVEVLRSPTDANELKALIGGLAKVGDALTERGIVSAFCFAPADDLQLATAFVAAGYQKTGLLASCLLIGDERKDAILWTRKLAAPTD